MCITFVQCWTNVDNNSTTAHTTMAHSQQQPTRRLIIVISFLSSYTSMNLFVFYIAYHWETCFRMIDPHIKNPLIIMATNKETLVNVFEEKFPTHLIQFGTYMYICSAMSCN